nr:hypothetical protein [Lacticaseibacillus camelliae]
MGKEFLEAVNGLAIFGMITLQCRVGRLRDFGAHPGRPQSVGVVLNDHHAVCRFPHVELDVLGAVLEGQVIALKGFFRRFQWVASVADDDKTGQQQVQAAK